MFEIASADFIAPDVKRFRIIAPAVAKKHQAGQFVILRVHDLGERIPITIAESDPDSGEITIIVQGIGRTTKDLNRKTSGDQIPDLVGPLGQPTHIENWGKAVIVSGGVGTAEALPIARAMKAAGNEVISIIGARTKSLVIAEELMKDLCDEVIVTTDDGSYGIKGLVIEPLRPMLESSSPPRLILAVGPLPMMKAVAELTRPYNIKTMVSLNTIMIDGTGMCGGCRATVDGKTVFVCVDGPEFDGHKVDFGELQQRIGQFKNQERQSLDQFLRSCRAEKSVEG
ncbi:MAG: sulfide/dihydroorotate dehydrogenase-like FAD/NAD-binding protein [Candidatus Marinimicrobia bacterium]|nr:sulfide/dihydroorotate dehydrogenase-like FAD/NAD-binding protein [Candidatus Neomarinimicrobiota bacterium]